MTQKPDDPKQEPQDLTKEGTSPGNKARIITLTARRPVRIHENDWPIIASTRDSEVEGKETSKWWLTVRRHADGRCIVYARLEVLDESEKQTDLVASGELLDPDEDIAESVRAVGEDCHCSEAMIGRCIASLPVEDL